MKKDIIGVIPSKENIMESRGEHYYADIEERDETPMFLPVQDDGKKLDQGKPRFDLEPPVAKLELAKVLQFGAVKYGPENWRKVDNLKQRYLAASMRHINAYQRGETLDDESGLHHLAHAVASLMFITEVELCEPK